MARGIIRYNKVLSLLVLLAVITLSSNDLLLQVKVKKVPPTSLLPNK